MYTDFSSLLVLATLCTGGLLLLERILFRSHKKPGAWVWVIEQARGFFPALLIVCFLRAFVMEPFRIPSGSMKPTLLVGDFILVNKGVYSWRLPLWGVELYARSHPERGDIIVFRHPHHLSVDLIKRVVAVPGDRVAYINNHLILNGEPLPLSEPVFRYDQNEAGAVWPVLESTEWIPPHTSHQIYQREGYGADMPEVIVPPGHYCVMGDNRNNSEDSRRWGFVPEEYILGKAFFIWMSWDADNYRIRWNRLGAIS